MTDGEPLRRPSPTAAERRAGDERVHGHLLQPRGRKLVCRRRPRESYTCPGRC